MNWIVASAKWLGGLSMLAILSIGLKGCLGEHIEVHGAGASFPAPIYARWRALYHREHPDISIHYRAVGSGRGIKAITAGEVDFGASDALLKKSEERALRQPLLSIPTVMGPVVLAYNLPRLEGELTLSGDLIAGIYLGDITHWNDERIALLNPGINLPALPIRVAHRSDSSGTTHIFTDYLSEVSEEWRNDVGRGKRVFWPTGNEWAGDGNDGVAHRILLEPGGIGYLELKYAQNAGLNYAALINRAGKRVRPTAKAVQEAEQNTPASPESYLKQSIVNAPGEGSYPISAFTYLLVYRDISDMESHRAHALIDFLKWVLNEGQPEARKLHYVPLPEELRLQVLEDVASIKLPPLPTVH
ncbi:MAG: phosphate ABC transporter substrate-binding protein PstS [Candidatus Thiodiazotropha sp. (ex Ctena orbiculata)]|uniref:Phosphate-binding protein PstS n=1 Tax=Candidatus Thiodiazotropha taylori TaxID=2792791 RepID=A0A944QX64_9GAMM|nr:phosphate ABC transporter substrate-binding protein PstS [Candidatus Thiodiazotropha taylori]MBV2138949.1 phosphate ABC transporter substrate-binding protein PstS [Candidatus Thiodiazotropha taylori]